MRRWPFGISRVRASWCWAAMVPLLSVAGAGVPVLRAQRATTPTPDVRAAALPSSPQQLLADTLFFPEGLDVDVRSGAMLVTSIASGRIIEVSATGAWRDVFAVGTEPRAGVFGVAVDTACACLWVTTAPHPRRLATMRAQASPGAGIEQVADRDAALLKVRRSDGATVQRFVLGDGTGMPGELAVSPRGDVLVSDGVRGVMYRLAAGGDSLEEIRHSLLRSPQGIALRADGRVAWIADWSRGLLHWDLATDQITAVTVADAGALRGLDGLRRYGEWLIAVQNGTSPARVLGLRLSSDGLTVQRVEVLDELRSWQGEPTVGAVQGRSFVFVATSQWPFWSDTGVRRGDVPLPSVKVRRVTLALPP